MPGFLKPMVGNAVLEVVVGADFLGRSPCPSAPAALPRASSFYLAVQNSSFATEFVSPTRGSRGWLRFERDGR